MWRQIGVIARLLLKGQFAHDPHLFQQPQRRVHSSQRYVREEIPHPFEHLPHSWVISGVNHHLGNGQSLGRQADPQRFQPGHQVFLSSQNFNSIPNESLPGSISSRQGWGVARPLRSRYGWSPVPSRVGRAPKRVNRGVIDDAVYRRPPPPTTRSFTPKNTASCLRNT